MSLPNKIDIENMRAGKLEVAPGTFKVDSSEMNIETLAEKINEIISFLTHQEERNKEEYQGEEPCMWCGKTFYEHEPSLPEGAPIPRVPCLLLRSGFVSKKAPPSTPKESLEEELKKLLDNPRTGLKESSDTNKTRYAILSLLSQAVEAERGRIRETIRRKQKDHMHNSDVGMTLSEILTEIK